MLAQAEWPSFLDWVPHGFDSWEAWVAIGTLALAGATLLLARATRSDVDISAQAAEATRQSVEVAERAFEAGIRPIVAMPAEQFPNLGIHGSTLVLTIPVRNVGSGLALLQQTQWLSPPIPPGSTRRATSTGSAMPAAEAATLRFEVTFDTRESAKAYAQSLRTTDGVTVDVRYCDMNGTQPARTELDVHFDPSLGFGFKVVRLYNGEQTTPYATLPSRGVTVALGNTAVEHSDTLAIDSAE